MPMRPAPRALLVASLLLGTGLAACARGDAGSADRDSTVVAPVANLTGAGATFPYPVYASWFNRYGSATGIYINYQSIGSGGGIAQLAAGTVDFGATDSPTPVPELARDGATVTYVPTVVGAVSVAYNLAGVREPLRFDGATLADVYRGRVTRWDDARIAALNAGVKLPATGIVVVHRADGSGTTDAFTRYLAAASQAWRAGPGTGTAVSWPTGLGARGNEGVAAQVKQTPGAIGYVEYTYALQNRLPSAALRNPAGAFVTPSVQAMSAAAHAVAATLPPGSDFRVPLVNAPAPDAYPLASFSWIVLRVPRGDATRAGRLRAFLRWALTEGAEDARALAYAPLPDALRDSVLARLARPEAAPGASAPADPSADPSATPR
jgi:phosphate transport system substrate-binding protein